MSEENRLKRKQVKLDKSKAYVIMYYANKPTVHKTHMNATSVKLMSAAGLKTALTHDENWIRGEAVVYEVDPLVKITKILNPQTLEEIPLTKLNFEDDKTDLENI